MHAVLADSPLPWLLLFDNAPDADSLRDFLPPAGRGHVLITSQSANWPPGQGIVVPVLEVDVAARFLTARTGDSDGQAATELARDLGGLPLALEQAAAYIQATGQSMARYLNLFRERRAELLARGEPALYDRTVARRGPWRSLHWRKMFRKRSGCCGCLLFWAPAPPGVFMARASWSRGICSRAAEYSRAIAAAGGGSAVRVLSSWAVRAGPGYLP